MSEPKFVGGSLCLDFVNTVGGRVDTRRDGTVIRDKLPGYRDLVRWGLLAGLASPPMARSLELRAGSDAPEADAVLQRAIALREALYGTLKAVMEGRRPNVVDVELFRGELSISRSHSRLSNSSKAFVWEWYPPDALDCILWPVAQSAADLLTSGDLPKLHQCEGPECGWLFLDTSRNGRRRWCVMQDCGNRAKVRRFRERQNGSSV
jgi:predicted RNA-binding Zn ribbon-like protein